MSGVCCAQEAEAEYDTAMVENDDGEPADRQHEAGVRRPLRASVVAKLVETKLRHDLLASIANSTGVVLPAMEEVSTHRDTRHDTTRIALATTHDTHEYGTWHACLSHPHLSATAARPCRK